MEQSGEREVKYQVDDDFDSFEDFEEYFIHCILTINHRLGTKYRKKDIALKLGFTSGSALSLRLNVVEENLPRFNLKHLWLYLNAFRDPAPIEYLEYFKKKMMRKEESGIVDRLGQIGKELERIFRALKGKTSN
jgi:hypothetical protein